MTITWTTMANVCPSTSVLVSTSLLATFLSRMLEARLPDLAIHGEKGRVVTHVLALLCSVSRM